MQIKSNVNLAFAHITTAAMTFISHLYIYTSIEGTARYSHTQYIVLYVRRRVFICVTCGFWSTSLRSNNPCHNRRSATIHL